VHLAGQFDCGTHVVDVGLDVQKVQTLGRNQTIQVHSGGQGLRKNTQDLLELLTPHDALHLVPVYDSSAAAVVLADQTGALVHGDSDLDRVRGVLHLLHLFEEVALPVQLEELLLLLYQTLVDHAVHARQELDELVHLK